MRRFLLAYALPTVAVLAAICLPLILGQRTLYLRDVFGTHLAMKSSQAEALRGGELALIDPYRGGGQASLGNLNTVPLYPTNLLYLVGDSIWALNAHFWIHLLLAPFGLYWLARRWRLGRPAAWMGAVAYGAGGYLLSTLNLYNLVAPAALAPFLIAASMSLAERRSARTLCTVAGIWLLMVLGGDPMTAALALGMALAAAIASSDRRWRAAAPLSGAIACGTLLALPQLVELVRILPHTYRGFWGYSAEGATMASWNPLSSIESLLPLFFGWPDLGFWGRGFYGDDLPLLFSLAPGVLVIGLVLASGRPARSLAWWSWGSVALGLFLVLGKHNPILALLLRLTRVDLIRLPVKFWLLVAIGLSLLAAIGFERLLRGEPSAFRRALLGMLTLYAAVWLWFTLGGSAAFGWARGMIPSAFGDGYVEQERLRWAGLALISLLILAAALGVLKLARRHPAMLAILPFLHVVSQIFFLKPLLATDDVRPYLEPPALLAEIPEGSTVVHGDTGGLFGPVTLPLDRYPDRSLIWFQRQTHEELYPHAGVRFRRRYELDYSPEGLDAFLTRATAQAMKILPDPARVKLLEASGVDRLLITRRLSVLEAAGQVELSKAGVGPIGELNVYTIPRRVDRARLVGSIVRAPHLNGTLEALTSPAFDARRMTVLPGTGGPTEAPPGSVRWIEESTESMVLEVDSPSGGALVIQRTPLPLYRAEIDGVEAPIVPADLHRIGIEVGPGPHTVRIWVPRNGLHTSLALALGSAILFALVATRWRRRSAGS